MSFSLQPPLPSVSDFCRQMLLTTKEQLSYEYECQKAYEDNRRRYLEWLKDLCDMVAERFGMQRDEVLKGVSDFTGQEDSVMNNFLTFTPSNSGLSPRDSDVLPDLMNSCGNVPSQTAKRRKIPAMCPITPESELGNSRHSSDLVDYQDPIEAFFNHHPALDVDSAVICITILRSTGTLDSLKKLHEVLDFCHGERGLKFLDTAASCAQIWRFLQTSDAMKYTAICLRRVYLWQLCARYRQLRSLFQTDTRQSGIEGRESTSTRAQDMMMSEIFNGRDRLSLEVWEKNRKQLKNYLAAGRKWDCLVSEYNIVLLMLVVTGRGTGVNSQSIEHLRDDQIEALLQGFHIFRDRLLKPMCNMLEGYVMDILRGRSPTYRPKFVAFEWQSLAAQSLGDEELLGLCQSEMVINEG